MQQEAIYFRGCYALGISKGRNFITKNGGIGVELMPSFYIVVEIEKI